MQTRFKTLAVACLCLVVLAGILGSVAAEPSRPGRCAPDTVSQERLPRDAWATAQPGQDAQPLAILEIVLQPGSGEQALLLDAHIDDWYPTDNFGNDGALQVRPSSDVRHTLMRWELSGAVPTGATILNARVELHTFYRSRDWDLSVAAYDMLVPWEESSVTWNQASTGVPWNTPGCGVGTDRSGTPVGATSILGSDPVPGWFQIDVTPLVQGWVADLGSNYGLILVASGSTVRYDFQSAEGSLDLRPKLVIEYSDEAVTLTPTQGTGASPTATRTATSGPTPTATSVPNGWIDISRAIPAYCMGVFDGDTTGKADNVQYYGSVIWPETGPEDVYLLNKTVTSDLSVRIEAWQLGDDLDIFLLSGPDPSTLMGGDRVGWGDSQFTYPNLPPGAYYIVVDGVYGSQGPYRLTIDCEGEPTPTATLTATPTRTNTPVFSYYPMLYKMPSPTPTITPTFTPAPTVLPYARGVNCGSSELVLYSDGQYYEPDQLFTPGIPHAWGYVGGGPGDVWSTDKDIANTEDDVIYQTHRYAMNTYYFTVPNGRFDVTLHLAELFQFAHAGDRVFAVEMEGQRVLDSFDMIARGLKYTAYSETFQVDVLDEQLQISFVSQSAYAPAVNGIRVNLVGPVIP